MAQNAHQPARIATLHGAHDASLELFEPRVRQIKRHRDTRHAVGREPLLAEPYMR